MKIDIDGIGVVEIDDSFADLSPDEQRKEIDEIVASQERADPDENHTTGWGSTIGGTIGSIAGGIGGSIAGAAALGAGAVPGAIIGSSTLGGAGGALGEKVEQWFLGWKRGHKVGDNEDIADAGTSEFLFGLIPGVGGNAGKAGARFLAKSANSTAKLFTGAANAGRSLIGTGAAKGGSTSLTNPVLGIIPGIIKGSDNVLRAISELSPALRNKVMIEAAKSSGKKFRPGEVADWATHLKPDDLSHLLQSRGVSKEILAEAYEKVYNQLHKNTVKKASTLYAGTRLGNQSYDQQKQKKTGPSGYAQGGALSNKISKIHGEGYKAPGQAYAIAKSMGYAQGGDLSGILGEAEGWKQEGQKYADQYGGGSGFDISPSDLLDFIPIIGDLKGAYEVIQEIRKPNPNWLIVGALAGAGIIGLVPGIGDAAAIAIKKGARSAGKIAGKATADVVGHTRNLFDYDPSFVGRGKDPSKVPGVGADRTVMANYDDYGHYKYPKSEVTEQIAKDKAQHATEYASGNQWDFMGANNPEIKRINREASIARASRKKRAPFKAAENKSMYEYLRKPHLSNLADEKRYVEALSDYASSSSKKISRTKLQHVKDFLSASNRSHLYDSIEAATKTKLNKMF